MVSLNNILDRREEILRIAAKHGASNVRIFGSVVRGQADAGSDLDILVHLNDECSLLDQVALMYDLEALLGCKVDVVEDDALHRSLRDSVLAEALAL
jgi:predicted nucleotidyltransferase